MAFYNANTGKWSAFLAALWLMIAGGSMVFGDSAGEGNGAVGRLQAELPERKFSNLDQILQKGLANGPSVIMREWDAAVAHEVARGQNGPMLPSLNAWVNAGMTREDRSGPSGYVRDYQAVLYSVNFYQPIYHWGALSKNYQMWQLREAMAKRNIGETRRLLAIDIRARYFDIIMSANALKLARENFKRLETEKKDTEQLIADGVLAAGVIDGPNRALDLARPELEQAEEQYKGLRQTLIQITGMSDSELGDLPEEIPVIKDITEVLNVASGAIIAPPSNELNNLYDDIKITKLDYDINKVRQRPKFGFSASAGQSPDTSYNAPKSLITSYNASLSLQWNLFDGFATQSAKRASLNRLRALETQRTVSEQKESAERRAEAAKLRMQWERLQNTERDLARSRGGYELTQQDYKNGMVASRNVEDAFANYKNALQGTFAARANFYTALATYLSNRGQDPAVQAK